MAKQTKESLPSSFEDVRTFIITIRGQRVILDRDLARLYGTKTKRLNEQVKRNESRFPHDFMFQLTEEEMIELVANCDRFKTLKHSSALPFVFTEHGTVMAANVLNNKIAIDTSILIVRAFIRAREIIAEQVELKRQLDALEQKVAKAFKDNEEELQAIRFAIHQLMQPSVKSTKQPLGFGPKGR